MTGLKEPLRSQVQLKMVSFADVREWILQYESLTTPWGFVVPSKGSSSNQDVPQPMDVDVIKGKGKDKGKKGKDKGKKGKGKDAKGRPGDGKGGWNNVGAKPWSGGGWASNGWSSAGGWQQGGGWSSGKGPWKGQAKGKGGAGKDTDVCNLCGQRGHWKWECPTKGKSKAKINQVEVHPPASSAASTVTSASTTLPSASQYRGSVNRVEACQCETLPECQVTQVTISASWKTKASSPWKARRLWPSLRASPQSAYEEEWFPGVATQDYHEALEFASGAQVFAMDVTDGDGEWCCSPCLGAGPGDEPWAGPARVQAVRAERAEEFDVVIDSGADVSVAPLRFGSFGTAARSAGVVMQDAQGHRIAQHGSRVLDLDVGTLEGGKVTIREKFAIAKIEAVIVSLGRLMRQGWCLGSCGDKPFIEQHGNQIP